MFKVPPTKVEIVWVFPQVRPSERQEAPGYVDPPGPLSFWWIASGKTNPGIDVAQGPDDRLGVSLPMETNAPTAQYRQSVARDLLCATGNV